MAIFTASQIASTAKQVGFSGSNLTMAVAIALAESGGNTTVVNSIGAVGLWQIYQSAHPQWSISQLQNPVTNAQAAYAISSSGSNWRPWSTAWSDGQGGVNGGSYLGNGSPYQKYLVQAQNATGAGVNNSPGQRPWYTYPRIDNIGSPDPFGGIPKPDSNIQIPAGYPVTALLPGTVSGTDSTSSWAGSVTIRLDTPLNSLATHTAYIHLGSISVRTGQHVSAGQLIGTNGYASALGSQKVPLGFALYPGDQYGYGSAWSYMTRANLLGPLNPVPILNAASSGALNIPLSFSSSSGSSPTYVPLLQQVHETLVDTPGFYGIALALDEAEKFPGWIDLTTQQPDVSILGQDTGVSLPDIPGEVRSIGATVSDNFVPFIFRGSLVIIGGILLVALILKMIEGPLKTIVPIAELAAAGA